MKKTLLLLLLPTLVFAQNTELKDAVHRLKNDPFMPQNSWGLMVMNCKTGEVIAEHNTDSMLIPASVIKIFSTALALETLGDTFHFRTKVYYTGIVSNHSLNGDIWIEGGADPTIGMDFWGKLKFIDALYKELKDLDIDTIGGDFIGQAAFFDSLLIPSTYSEDDYGNYYGAGTSALIWDGNRVELDFSTPYGVGQATTLKSFFPPFPQLNIENKTTSGKSGTGDNSIVWGGPFNYDRVIDGTLSPGKLSFKVYASSPDPALGFVLAVRSYLEEKGIVFLGNCKSTYSKPIPENAHNLMVWESPELKEIVAYTLTYSHNVTAETLFKMAAKKIYSVTSYAHALSALDSFIVNTVSNSLNYRFYDGSGLSKANKVSPAFVVDFLKQIKDRKWFDVFYNSLPVAGKTGTLKSMFQGSAAYGKLHAKSGYMKTVRAYSGYVENKKGDLMAFAVIVNNYKDNAYVLKKKLEELMIAITVSE